MAQEPAGATRASRALRLAVVSAVLVGALLVYRQLWGPGADDGDDKPPRQTADGTLADGGDNDDETSVTTVFADPGTPVEPTCPATDGSSPRQVNFSAPPPTCIDLTKVYVATIDTS